jgi:hypothetical protein
LKASCHHYGLWCARIVPLDRGSREPDSTVTVGCLPGVIDAFVAAGSVDGLDTSCVASMAPPPFQLP